MTRILRLQFPLVVVVLAACASGCATADKRGRSYAGPATQPATRAAAATNDAAPAAPSREDQIRRDPRGFIREVAEKTRALRHYTVTLTREERRGLFGKVFGPERIACWFRQEPFSIRMKWLDQDVKYGESTYVAGQEQSRVRFVPRHGFLGLEPGITVVDVQTPVTWGEAKNPVTDFGLQRMLERTLKSMGEAGDTVKITYVGRVNIDGYGDVHHLTLAYPPDRWKVPYQDLFIDPQTELPVGTVLKLPDGRLDAAYFYTALDTGAKLSDADFLLEIERTRAAAGKKSSATPGAAEPRPAADAAN